MLHIFHTNLLHVFLVIVIKKITIINSSLTSIAGVENVKISISSILRSVLHVPKLSSNLISKYKVSHDMDYKIFFSFHSLCILRPNFEDNDWTC